MSRGKRYEEPKLNMKKVFAVIIAIIVVIMFVFIIKGIIKNGTDKTKITSQSYFVAFKDNKWGVIDEQGNDVITPSYQEMIIIPNNKQDVFICTYDVNYETEEYKTKALNSKNEEIFTQYEQIEALQNNNNANIVWYEENILRVKKDGKYGAINLEGKQIIPIEYEEITAINGIKNALKVKKDGKYGIINNEGNVIINTEYTDITNLGKDDKAGYIVKNEEGKFGIVDYSNTKILDTKYEEIKKVYSNDLYVVKDNGKLKLIDKAGEDVLTDKFDNIYAILKNADNGVIFEKNGKYGVMKLNGEISVEASYEDLREAKSGILIAKENGKYGIIDIQKQTKVEFKYNMITYYEKADIYSLEEENYNNLMLNGNYEQMLSGILMDIDIEKGYMKLKIGDEYKYYNLKFEQKDEKEIFSSNTLFLSKKDGKYGFVDKDGKEIVQYIYDDATDQNAYGYAGVKKDGKWGCIDSKGKVVIEPTYNLEEYLKIDFIGKWHLGLDLNMNYYNQE